MKAIGIAEQFSHILIYFILLLLLLKTLGAVPNEQSMHITFRKLVFLFYLGLANLPHSAQRKIIYDGLECHYNLDKHPPPRAKVLKTVFLSAPPDFLVFCCKTPSLTWQMVLSDGFP